MRQNDHDGDEHHAFTGGKRETAGKAGPAALQRLAREHDLQLELCVALEHIADGLPGRIDFKLLRAVIGVLENGMAGHFAFEEEVLFPLLRRNASFDPSLIAALNQLENEHVRDSDLCHELAEELKALSVHGEARNANMLAYMLRGFFEGQRRHIEWENSIVLPAARRHLTTQDLEAMPRYAVRGPLRSASLKIPVKPERREGRRARRQ